MGPDAITPEVIVPQGKDSSASGNPPRELLSQSISVKTIDNKGGSSSSQSIMVDGVISQLSEGSDDCSDGHVRGAGGSRVAEQAEIMEDGEASTVNEDLGNGPVNGGGEGNCITAAQDELGEKVNALENTEHVEISAEAKEDPSTDPGTGDAAARRTMPKKDPMTGPGTGDAAARRTTTTEDPSTGPGDGGATTRRTTVLEDPSTGPGTGGATVRAPTMKRAAHVRGRGLRLKGMGQARAYLVELLAQDVFIRRL